MTNGTRRGWGVSVTPRPHFTPEKPERLGGLQGRSAQVRKISPPIGIRSPDRPTRSPSLYLAKFSVILNILFAKFVLKSVKKKREGKNGYCSRRGPVQIQWLLNLSVNTNVTGHQFCNFPFHLRLMYMLFIEQNFLDTLYLLVGSLIQFLATWLQEIRQLTKAILLEVS
jgi:hypothetical protein